MNDEPNDQTPAPREPEISGRATYSPEDNKLRLYADERLSPALYEETRKMGFGWAPKQKLFVAPAWTPAREDFLIRLVGEIQDEDMSLIERQEMRADRFDGYRENRLHDAGQAREAVARIADNIPLGQPILIGHHSERHARRDAEKIERGMRLAVTMWDRAEYWTDRAASAIAHGKYKERPDVRARRIKKIEAEIRQQQRGQASAECERDKWRAVLRWLYQVEEPETAKKLGDHYAAGSWAEVCAEYRKGAVSLEDCACQMIVDLDAGIAHPSRWLAHLEHRLCYEKTMLGESGGTASDQKAPEVGGGARCWATRRRGEGAFSWIVKVNKVSITVYDNWGNGGRNFTRTIPFDKLSALASKAEVAAAQAAGRLIEFHDATGFVIHDSDPTPAPEPESAPEPTPDPELEAAKVQTEAIRDSLKAGIEVVSADQLFPTPRPVIAVLMQHAQIGEGMTVLEPSAGTGALVMAAREFKPAKITAIECNRRLYTLLCRMADTALCGDFLSYEPGHTMTFDRIVMNPPFSHGDDIKHIRHAARFLAPGGRLVAVMANGPRQRAAFDAEAVIELPEGSFSSQGTQVRTCIVILDAPRAPAPVMRIALQPEEPAPDVMRSALQPPAPAPLAIVAPTARRLRPEKVNPAQLSLF